ncbi:OST-HTH associated domain protein [Babesia caballi]|uniref:OST-HTH associated domain protein n=1 Tax=Babesia caballi TaxID=5871 RepID=A0AAV4LZR2_BABCB|nr:OST-HTH associated domain protein [Babesia caballi]
MEPIHPSVLDAKMINPQLMARKTPFGCEGSYPNLMSSISTIVDDDDQSLLSGVLENFSCPGGDGVSYAAHHGPVAPPAYPRRPVQEAAAYGEHMFDLYGLNNYAPVESVPPVVPNFKWTSASANSCFGAEKAQLYERLFDSYITLFNAERSPNVQVNTTRDVAGMADVAKVSPAWDTGEVLSGLDKLCISERSIPAELRDNRNKEEPSNAVDKGKGLWRRKRNKFKALEKRTVPQLTGREFHEAMEYLKQILDSLYRDQIPPTFFNVRSRFVEFDTKNIPVEHILNICQRRPDVFRVETNEIINQTYIYFVKPPSYFTRWIDRNDLTDVYPEAMWDQFLDFLVELVNNPENKMPVFPGSIYGTAKVFQKLDLPFFEGMTLGMLCHVVQLAVRVRKLLMYELKTMKPNLLAILQACLRRSK